ncbi:MAG: ribose 1,5-bisphosphokinase [Candidatus Endobugula sp.]|jgi:ribose 1,5-bisphosphokinase
MTTATLFYVVGASGSGKDSILRYLREHLINLESVGQGLEQRSQPIAIAHRYITRASDDNEQAVCLSKEEFSLRQQHQLFALEWQANGFDYAIGKEIDQWLAAGVSVIVNGSRDYINTAKARYPQSFHSVRIDVADHVLQQRLDNRSRETATAIKDRMLRHQKIKDMFVSDSTIVNESTVANAAREFINIIDHVQK